MQERALNVDSRGSQLLCSSLDFNFSTSHLSHPMDHLSALSLPSQTPPSALRRCNSATSVLSPTPSSPHRAPSYGTTNTHAPPSLLDLELLSIPSPFSYTSLRDLLPSSSAAVNSPTASSSNSASRITIRNHLVKQAAWAYLQPMSASPSSPSDPNLLRRLCHRFSSCLSFILHHLLPSTTRIFNRILRLIRSHLANINS